MKRGKPDIAHKPNLIILTAFYRTKIHMTFSNTASQYGSVTKTFHWLTALLILTALPLGWFANQLAHAIYDPSIPTTLPLPSICMESQ